MEEPKEPQFCKVRILNGAKAFDLLVDDVKRKVYEYNTRISSSGYYLKPVHRVYRRISAGVTRIYEYYGRYWWRLVRRKGRLRWIYVGNSKPKGLPDFPPHELEGVSVMKEGNDIIIDCEIYDRFKHVFKGLTVERYL